MWRSASLRVGGRSGVSTAGGSARLVTGATSDLDALAHLTDPLVDRELAEEAGQHDLALDTTDRCGHLIQQRGHGRLRS